MSDVELTPGDTSNSDSPAPPNAGSTFPRPISALKAASVEYSRTEAAALVVTR